MGSCVSSAAPIPRATPRLPHAHDRRIEKSNAAEDAKKTKKSQSRTTKTCRCEDQDTCSHDWVLSDEGAGTVVKQRGKMTWAHKASTTSFAGQEILLDAVAMSDAASHDSRSLVPHLERLFDRYPELRDKVTRVLDDGALDDAEIKAEVADRFDAQLLASPNPRARKPIRDDLPRGMDHLTNLGVPVCAAGFPFDFLGCRHTDERYLFRAPDDEEGKPVCEGCSRAMDCLRAGSGRRHVTVPFERLPFLDPEFPYLSRRFQLAMARRTVIERPQADEVRLRRRASDQARQRCVPGTAGQDAAHHALGARTELTPPGRPREP